MVVGHSNVKLSPDQRGLYSFYIPTLLVCSRPRDEMLHKGLFAPRTSGAVA